ncbi:hypothetical protein DYB35_008639 [Aphanomyces astaci]|uniref:Uncharacterized protein n=1 Tax=Aphanomyces astaci TaxID=112090 RepID=A0A418CIN7_APHAT|nr:hypothetical protein DYB35_008639 [Aphanomyces astaci]
MARSPQQKARRAAAAAARSATISPSVRDTDDGPHGDDSEDDEDDDDYENPDDEATKPFAAGDDSSDSEAEVGPPAAKRAKKHSPRINFRNIVVRGFDPSRDIPIETYLRDFDRATRTYASINEVHWTDEALGAFLYEKLEGEAALWASSCSPSWTDADYWGTALKQHLMDQYSRTTVETIDDIRVAMSRLVKTKDQTWSAYGQAIEAAKKGHDVGHKFLVTCFENGLPTQYAWACRSNKPINVSQAAIGLQQLFRTDGVGVGGPDTRPIKTLSTVTHFDETNEQPPPPSEAIPSDAFTHTALRTLMASMEMMAQRMPGGRGLPTWHLTVDGVAVAARVDSCSTSCVGNETMATLGTFLRSSHSYVEGCTGNVLPVTQVRRVEWTVQQGTFVAEVHVVPGMSDRLLLGSDFMTQYGMAMIWSSRELHFPSTGPHGVRVPFTLESMRPGTATAIPVRRATLTRRVKLPAMCGGLTKIQVAAPDGTEVLFTPFPGDGRAQALMAATVSTVRAGAIVVPAVNTTGSKQRSREREAVGLWTPLSHELTVLDMVDVTIDAVEDWLSSINAEGVADLPMEDAIRLDHLNAAQRAQMLRQTSPTYQWKRSWTTCWAWTPKG